MPLVSTQTFAGYWEPQARGPVAQAVPVLSPAVPTSIAASGSYVSTAFYADGFVNIAVGVTSTQTGTLQVQRYIDAAGTVAQGAPSSVALTAATPAVLNITDNLPFQSFKVTITNTGASAATISGFAILLNGQ